MSSKIKIQAAIDTKFIEQRKVFLWGQVDDSTAKHVIDRLMYLDALEVKFKVESKKASHKHEH